MQSMWLERIDQAQLGLKKIEFKALNKGFDNEDGHWQINSPLLAVFATFNAQTGCVKILCANRRAKISENFCSVSMTKPLGGHSALSLQTISIVGMFSFELKRALKRIMNGTHRYPLRRVSACTRPAARDPRRAKAISLRWTR